MTRNLVRWGLWALPVGGLLTGLFWLSDLLSGGPDPIKDPTGFARTATSAGSILFADAYIVGGLCILFGLIALLASLTGTRGEGWGAVGALAGLVAMAAITSINLLLSVGDAIVGDTVLSGHPDAGATYRWMSGGNWNGRIYPVLAVLVVSGLIGAVGLGVGVWRSGQRPRWVAVVFAIAFLGEAIAFPVAGLVASALLIVAGSFLARGTRVPVAAGQLEPVSVAG